MQINSDASILIHRGTNGDISIVSIYVDDFFIASYSEESLVSIKSALSKE